MKNLILILILLLLFHQTILSQSGWYWQNPYPQGNALYSISFVSVVADRGWAVGDLGTAIYTTDGGSTWDSTGVYDSLCPGTYDVWTKNVHGCLANSDVSKSS